MYPSMSKSLRSCCLCIGHVINDILCWNVRLVPPASAERHVCNLATKGSTACVCVVRWGWRVCLAKIYITDPCQQCLAAAWWNSHLEADLCPSGCIKSAHHNPPCPHSSIPAAPTSFTPLLTCSMAKSRPKPKTVSRAWEGQSTTWHWASHGRS